MRRAEIKTLFIVITAMFTLFVWIYSTFATTGQVKSVDEKCKERNARVAGDLKYIRQRVDQIYKVILE